MYGDDADTTYIETGWCLLRFPCSCYWEAEKLALLIEPKLAANSANWGDAYSDSPSAMLLREVELALPMESALVANSGDAYSDFSAAIIER